MTGHGEVSGARASDLLGLYTTATAFEASTRGGGNTEDFTERIHDYFATIPTERYPMITSMAAALTRNVGDERFEFGLDILVAGLARQAQRGA
ncbi:TetR/AcrR family transcriptional regulator C-terminal domain-containing protein [Kitasatospora purpeofusca]|uniref:TetR/AcrR family transcriptional regulator C-terminal domain-containing protein n=1 Tax=Kitasatospora purpeofusca TaxID=67352 RepID=A0ABZ1UBZ2_9ACTN|nr:TetR/AcrR family transcriptional regulator C-terminal domain-containing protein [Kitasatospora purpeofusca]